MIVSVNLNFYINQKNEARRILQGIAEGNNDI